MSFIRPSNRQTHRNQWFLEASPQWRANSCIETHPVRCVSPCPLVLQGAAFREDARLLDPWTPGPAFGLRQFRAMLLNFFCGGFDVWSFCLFVPVGPWSFSMPGSMPRMVSCPNAVGRWLRLKLGGVLFCFRPVPTLVSFCSKAVPSPRFFSSRFC